MKQLKKFMIGLLLLLIAIPIGYLAFLMFIGPICNDIKAADIEKQLKSIPLPDDTGIIESYANCLNSSGTGNHVEICTALLIRSPLPEESVNDFFQDYYCYSVPPDGNPYPPLFSFIRFVYLEDGGKRENCYIISKIDEAFTQTDIRGH